MRSNRRELALGLLAHVVGHPGLGDLRAVLVDDGALVLAELLADRVQLPAQEVLALLLLRAGLDVLADALAHLQLGQPLVLELTASSSRSTTSSVSSSSTLLREGRFGRVARRVGERARLGDRAHERADAAVVAAQLEDLLDDGAVLALELARQDGRRRLVGPLVDLDAQPALRVGVRGAGDAAVHAAEDDGRAGARAGGRARPRRRRRRPSRTRCSCRGTSSTRVSSPTSTGRVTVMPGKTTVSSRGTRSRSLTIFHSPIGVLGIEIVPTENDLRAARNPGPPDGARYSSTTILPPGPERWRSQASATRSRRVALEVECHPTRRQVAEELEISAVAFLARHGEVRVAHDRELLAAHVRRAQRRLGPGGLAEVHDPGVRRRGGEHPGERLAPDRVDADGEPVAAERVARRRRTRRSLPAPAGPRRRPHRHRAASRPASPPARPRRARRGRARGRPAPPSPSTRPAPSRRRLRSPPPPASAGSMPSGSGSGRPSGTATRSARNPGRAIPRASPKR